MIYNIEQTFLQRLKTHAESYSYLKALTTQHFDTLA